jgi:hypothetical protein
VREGNSVIAHYDRDRAVGVRDIQGPDVHRNGRTADEAVVPSTVCACILPLRGVIDPNRAFALPASLRRRDRPGNSPRRMGATVQIPTGSLQASLRICDARVKRFQEK